MTNITSNTISEILDTRHVSKSKGVFTVRRPYYYRPATRPEDFAEAVSKKLQEAGITSTIMAYDDCWKVFKGGASVAQQSHYWVKFSVEDVVI